MNYLKILSVKAWAGIVAFLTLAFAVLKSRYDNMRRKQAEKRADEYERIIEDVEQVKRARDSLADPVTRDKLHKKYLREHD